MTLLEHHLNQLVSFKTVTGNKQAITDLYDYVAQITATYGLNQKRFSSNGHDSLLIATKSLSTPSLTLQAHVDVVPGPDELFRLKGDDARWYGRGVSDMKFAVASYLYAFEQLHKEKILSHKDICILLTADEEIGGFDGVSAVLDKGFSTKFVFLPDGADDAQGCGVVEAAKGVIHLKATTIGRSAHGSMPWLGENAIEKAWRFKTLLENSLTNLEQINWGNTISLGKISAGQATNQVPDLCEMFLDIRFTPDKSLEHLVESIKSIAQTESVAVEIMVSGEGYALDKDHLQVQSWLKALDEHKWIKDYGSSDARFFVAHGIPVLMTKPATGGMHSNEEWLGKESFQTYSELLTNWLRTQNV